MKIILLVIILFLPCKLEWILSTFIYNTGLYFLYVYFRTNYLKNYKEYIIMDWTFIKFYGLKTFWLLLGIGIGYFISYLLGIV